ncbi:MAG TPA: putative inorganic carbon transporter subunit DabA [Chromobacteriaceae bacterium]|nr:putative inorganic carbon transporter subunit DabA [Chromobacteriaceae bacterium]
MRKPDLNWKGAVATAADRIAPSWPLDSLLASSPYWGLRDMTFPQAEACLSHLAHSHLHLDEAEYRRQYATGAITDRHVSLALREAGQSIAVEQWLAQTPDGEAGESPLLMSDYRTDPAGHAGMQDWRQVVQQQISQFCAAWFDRDQADWQPERDRSMYQAWLAEMSVQPVPSQDVGLQRQLQQKIAGLPQSHEALFPLAIERLQPAGPWLIDWFYSLLLRNSGWAAWCRYLQWQAELNDKTSPVLPELLAIQLAWEYLLDDGERGVGSLWQRWQAGWSATPQEAILCRRGLIWQRAAELATHAPVLAQLPRQSAEPGTVGRALHAVFCIDVRSEPMRRALEQVVPDSSTAGFAGFFGLPVAIRFAGEARAQARLPGLLAPRWEAVVPSEGKGLAEWGQFQRAPLSSFTLVESTGLVKAGKLLRKVFPSKARASLAEVDPWLNDNDHAVISAGRQLDTPAIVAALSTILPAMGLGKTFPRTVLLAGHASHSSNNPQASALQCGACGGHGGHLHVLLLSEWLQQANVRSGLAAAGLPIPPDTVFLPALHLTHSDELLVLQSPVLTAPQRQRAQELRPLLDQVEAAARARRAGKDGVPASMNDAELLARLRQKGHHWAETRPEWGLANNAFFIAAPRARTAALDLHGRAFLHEYDWRQDPDARRLTGILAGPLMVAHWINMQYFGSVVDTKRFGSGNKLLHNVVGGRIGVFEGNSGDLRIGLSWQSVHDGQHWRHQPLRLAVCLDAPAALIALALWQQPEVARLIGNGWLHLYRIAEGGVEQWHDGEWQVAAL